MPIPPNVWMPAAGNVADGILSGVTQLISNKKNRKFALQQYERERADALADWNAQNLYDSPAAQMARLKEAGLNPHLMYGGGGSVAQSATIRSAEMGKYTDEPIPNLQLGAGLGQMYNLQLMNAQTDNVKAQTDVARQEALNKWVNTIKQLFEGKHSEFDLNRKEELKQIIFEQGVADLNATKAQIDATTHANNRAADLHTFNKKEAQQRLDINEQIKKKNALEYLVTQLEKNQLEKTQPHQLEQIRQMVEETKQRIRLTLQQTKNEHEKTRLNKMEADAGKILQWIKSIRGGK